MEDEEDEGGGGGILSTGKEKQSDTLDLVFVKDVVDTRATK